jgi:hypothetical protein
VTQAAAPLCFLQRRPAASATTTTPRRPRRTGSNWPPRPGSVRSRCRPTTPYTDATNETAGANLGKHLARRPEETANLSATYVWPFRLTTTVAVQYAGESFDNASNSTRLEPYTLVDLRASYPVNDTVEIYGRVENVGDEQYETTATTASRAAGPSSACGPGSRRMAPPCTAFSARRATGGGAGGASVRAGALARRLDRDQSRRMAGGGLPSGPDGPARSGGDGGARGGGGLRPSAATRTGSRPCRGRRRGCGSCPVCWTWPGSRSPRRPMAAMPTPGGRRGSRRPRSSGRRCSSSRPTRWWWSIRTIRTGR